MKNKRAKIDSFVNFAEKELNLFRKNNKFSNLAQACEKTWLSFTLLLELKSGKEIKQTNVLPIVAKELGWSSEFYRAKILHIFHYEGSSALSFNEIANEVEEILGFIKSEV